MLFVYLTLGICAPQEYRSNSGFEVMVATVEQRVSHISTGFQKLLLLEKLQTC
jgi:hypothetical protein